MQPTPIYSAEGFKDNITGEHIVCEYCKNALAKFKIGRCFCCSENRFKCSSYSKIKYKDEKNQIKKSKDPFLDMETSLEKYGVTKKFLKIWSFLGARKCELCGRETILEIEETGVLPYLICLNNPKNLSIFNKDNWLVACSLCYIKIKDNKLDTNSMSKIELRNKLKSIRSELKNIINNSIDSSKKIEQKEVDLLNFQEQIND